LLAQNGAFTGPLVANGIGQSGTLTVSFSDETDPVAAQVTFHGAREGSFSGTVSGTLANLGITATAGSLRAADCTTWNAVSSLVRGADVDRLTGTYAGDCHRAADAREGDTGSFVLTRPGTLPATSPTCTLTVAPLAFGSPNAPLDHNAHPNLTVQVTASAPRCAWSAQSNAPDWLKGVRVDGTSPPSGNGLGSGAVTFDVEGQGNNKPNRTGTLTIAGATVTVYQGQ
jgi:hypothetical protein